MLRIEGMVVGLTTRAVRKVASQARVSFKWLQTKNGAIRLGLSTGLSTLFFSEIPGSSLLFMCSAGKLRLLYNT